MQRRGGGTQEDEKTCRETPGERRWEMWGDACGATALRVGNGQRCGGEPADGEEDEQDEDDDTDCARSVCCGCDAWLPRMPWGPSLSPFSALALEDCALSSACKLKDARRSCAPPPLCIEAASLGSQGFPARESDDSFVRRAIECGRAVSWLYCTCRVSSEERSPHVAGNTSSSLSERFSSRSL